VTSYADGSKISFEQAAVANATGMKVAKRGMLGHRSEKHIDALTEIYDIEEIISIGGIVDYVIGAKPGPGVYVFSSSPDDDRTRHYLDFYKLGKGPLYSFYTPYHLCYFEIVNSIVRMVDFKDCILSPIDGPVVDVIAIAKKNLVQGEMLDGIGGYTCYGQCENTEIARKENLLPIGISEGAIVRRNISTDDAITIDDIDFPKETFENFLFAQQTDIF
jgi:predicted homoserine dehydrogenase-like protein